MDYQSSTNQNDHIKFKFPFRIFFIIISISLVAISAMIYSFNLSYKMSAENYPLVDATMQIKLETTTAHLWFEEIISGDRNEKIENVIQHIDHAIGYADAMLNGGKNPLGIIVPTANPKMRKDIKEVLIKINKFKNITNERYATILISGVGTPIEQEYDDIFRSVQDQSEIVIAKLQETITSNQKKFLYLQLLLLGTLIVSTLYLLFIFYNYEKRRAKNLMLIQEANDQVKILSGFLPICASCKKIRDDNGYWNQIESYIKEHSEADFSHSICPECAKKLYPEFTKGSEAK